jgi:hypothetical protein
MIPSGFSTGRSCRPISTTGIKPAIFRAFGLPQSVVVASRDIAACCAVMSRKQREIPMRRFRIVSIVGSVALLVLLTIAAQASAAVLCQHPSGSIHVRDACQSNETLLDPAALGLVGPQGPAGPAGPAGPTGPAGPAGPAGSLTGYEIVTFDTTLQNVDEQIGVATCPAGKRVLGGGSFVFNDTTPISGDHSLVVTGESHPFPGFPSAGVDSWRVRAVRLPPAISSWHMRIFAVCAPVAP